jgi:hypothetical protein
VRWLLRPGLHDPSRLDVLELQVARVAPTAYCSLFVDQAVHSDGGSLYVATRVDPALLLLPLMDKCRER